AFGAELWAAQWRGGAREQIEEAAIEIRRVIVGRTRELGVAVEDGEMRASDVLTSDELETERIGRRGGAVLDGEGEDVAVAAEVEVGVAPRVEIATATQCQPGLRAAAAVLARMVHDED